MEQRCEVERDRFSAMLNYYLLPMEKLERVLDSMYFLRGDLSFPFAQGYCHPAGGFYGKLINYPDPDGSVDIFGRSYINTTKKRVGDALELIPIDEQLALNYRADPSLMNREGMPPFAEYHVRFSLDECVGFFDHRHSLRVAMEMYPWLARKISELGGFLGVPLERLGATGSTAYGKIEPGEEDIDLIIYGSVEQNREVIRGIDRWLEDPAHRVFEFGRHWAMRFMYGETLVCPFFIYGRENEIPLRDIAMEVVEHRVRFSGRVSDDLHSFYLPVLLRLEGARLDGKEAGEMPLIIYDSSVRGEFRQGDLLEGPAAVVDMRTPRDECRALLVTMGRDINKESAVCRA